ncbi:hypothetical protein F0562_026659 [Nyssa sinensis]|uniref:Quinate/shikimate 5-dehydrogenase/glutamyl-tRNA reductase domain-containing protein n=1 Tax=Nyssa sinensis TaxID=561372 RepID=A0A5J5BE20_9ASTE|nr:hypothetical protein F0562_026659 [Nyssa sinensis]
MPSWSRSPSLPYIGVKLVTYYSQNSSLNLPGVHASYVLFNSLTGQTLASLDGTELTLYRTSCVSGLASQYLSRPESEVLVMIGSGSLAPHLIKAHLTARPNVKRVIIWNRTVEKARILAEEMSKDDEFKGVSYESNRCLGEAVGMGDIVSCATNSETPLVRGAALKAGAHLDLVGSFKHSMRECDDEAIKKGRVFVDNEAALVEAGELVGAFERGVISPEEIGGNLVELIKGQKVGRRDSSEITVFKSVGSAIVDILSAQLLYESCMNDESSEILPPTSFGWMLSFRYSPAILTRTLESIEFSKNNSSTVVCAAKGPRPRYPRVWKTRRTTGTISKSVKLVECVKGLSNVKEEVYGALDSFIAWELEFPLIIVKKALKILENEKEWKRIIQVTKWMLSKGQGGTMGSYYSLLNALAEEGRLDEAEELWTKLFSENLESMPRMFFDKMISIYYKRGMHEKMFEIFADMDELGIRPNVSIVSMVGDVFQKLGMLDKYEKLKKKYAPPKREYRYIKGKRVRIRSKHLHEFGDASEGVNKFDKESNENPNGMCEDATVRADTLNGDTNLCEDAEVGSDELDEVTNSS